MSFRCCIKLDVQSRNLWSWHTTATLLSVAYAFWQIEYFAPNDLAKFCFEGSVDASDATTRGSRHAQLRVVNSSSYFSTLCPGLLNSVPGSHPLGLEKTKEAISQSLVIQHPVYYETGRSTSGWKYIEPHLGGDSTKYTESFNGVRN